MVSSKMVELLEARRLLAASYDLVDLGLGATLLPPHRAVLDVNDSGIVLGPTSIFAISKGKVKVENLDSGQMGLRLFPTGTSLVGVSRPASVSHAAILERQAGGDRNYNFSHFNLGTLVAGGNSVATDSEGSGVVGYSEDPTPGVRTHGFLVSYLNHTYRMFDLNDLRSTDQTWIVQNGIDISSSGQILISGITSGMDPTTHLGLMHPTRHGTGFYELIGTDGANRGLIGSELNNQGQIAGSAEDANGHPHALLWTGRNGIITAMDLGTLGGLEARALGLNNFGYVVGDATTAKGRTHGFLYDPSSGTMIDLNSLVEGSGLTIDHAAAINNSNFIAAEGHDAVGTRHAILLIPKIPTPAPPEGIFFANNGLTINGSAGADQILIETDTVANTIMASLNGKAQTFAADQVGAIRVNAGSGDDHVEMIGGRAINVVLNGDGDDDEIVAEAADKAEITASGGEGNDRITGNKTQPGHLTGDAGNDTLIGGDQYDVIYGGYGDDSIIGGEGVNTLRGEAGNDTIVGGSNSDQINGGAGDDSIIGGKGSDDIRGESGDDIIDAGGGDDTVFAGAGDDSVMAGEGNDVVYGDSGSDTLWGQAGDDIIGGDTGLGVDPNAAPPAEAGNDQLDGGRGDDYLVGNRQTVNYSADIGNDTFTGGLGSDIIDSREGDVVSDAGADDLIPQSRAYGNGALAVQQTATLQLYLPASEYHDKHASPVLATLTSGAGNFANSPFYLDSAGTLHMQDTVDRKFYLGEFFRNWGVAVRTGRHIGLFGRFLNPAISVTVNGNAVTAFDKTVIHQGDSVVVEVRI